MVVDDPLYFLCLPMCISARGINANIHNNRSIIHHHQPTTSHQRHPCRFSLYFDVVFSLVIVPLFSCITFTWIFVLPHFGQAICPAISLPPYSGRLPCYQNPTTFHRKYQQKSQGFRPDLFAPIVACSPARYLCIFATYCL